MVLGHRERCFKDAYLDGGYTLWVKTMELFLLTSIQILTDFLIIFPSALNERLPRLRTWFMTSWTKWCPRPYSKFAVILMIHGVWLFKARIQLGILEALNTANLHQGSAKLLLLALCHSGGGTSLKVIPVRQDRGAEGEGYGERCPLPIRLGGLGSVVSSSY